jgi:hypothetical protein
MLFLFLRDSPHGSGIERVIEDPFSAAKPCPCGRCAHANNPITTRWWPASYFASRSIFTVESAQVTARIAMVSLCCDGIRSANASHTTPCAKA